MQRTFEASGETLIILPISAFGIRRAQKQWQARNPAPTPPIVEVMLGEHKAKEENADDPAYIAAAAVWQEGANEATTVYALSTGVANKVPEDFAAAQREYFPDITPAEIKHLWVTAIVGFDRLEELMSFIIGSAMPTEKGIEQAELTFPPDSEQHADNAVPTAAPERTEAGESAPLSVYVGI